MSDAIKLAFSAQMEAMRQELDDLLRRASNAELRRPGIEGEWSCADVLAHFAGYTRGVADLLAEARGLRSLAPRYNAPPGLNDDDFNAIVVSYWRARPVQELLTEERAAFDALVAEVSRLTSKALLTDGYFAFAKGRSLDSILPAQSHQHYRDHLPALRHALRRSL